MYHRTYPVSDRLLVLPESVDSRAFERLAGTKDGRGKTRLIDRVREVLRFEANGPVPDMISRIELQARFCRAHLHNAPAGRLAEPGRQRQGLSAAVEDKAMIVPAEPRLELLDT